MIVLKCSRKDDKGNYMHESANEMQNIQCGRTDELWYYVTIPKERLNPALWHKRQKLYRPKPNEASDDRQINDRQMLSRYMKDRLQIHIQIKKTIITEGFNFY